MSAERRPGTEPAVTNGRNGESVVPSPSDRSSEEVVREMARDGRAGDRRPEARPRPAGATASADAVEQLRRSVADIKHDVRMLKVGLDKQSVAIERLVAAIEELASSEEE